MHPFRDGDTFSTFRNMVNKAVAEINSLDNNYVLKASLSELEEHFVEIVIIEPLVLYSDKRYIKNQSGTKIDLSIPFDGDPMLWRIRASTFSLSGYPEIEVGQNEIIFNVTFPDDSAQSDQLLAEIDRNTKILSEAVEYLKKDVNNHNKSAPNTIKQALEKKRTLAQSTTGAIAALGIPVKKPDEEPSLLYSLQFQQGNTNLNPFWKRKNINTY